jgi:hypothetical protein
VGSQNVLPVRIEVKNVARAIAELGWHWPEMATKSGAGDGNRTQDIPSQFAIRTNDLPTMRNSACDGRVIRKRPNYPAPTGIIAMSAVGQGRKFETASSIPQSCRALDAFRLNLWATPHALLQYRTAGRV